MSSLVDKEKTCEKQTEKKCKETKVRKKKAEEDCIEPQPPEVRDKVLFKPDSTDPVDRERAKCLKHCKVEPIYNTWKACDARVTRKLLYTAETCHDETIDLMEALDKCLKDTAFLQLK